MVFSLSQSTQTPSPPPQQKPPSSMASSTSVKPQQQQQLHNFALPELKWAKGSPSGVSRHRRPTEIKSPVVNDAGRQAEKAEEVASSDEGKSRLVIRIRTKTSKVAVEADVEDDVLVGDGEKETEGEEGVSVGGDEKEMGEETEEERNGEEEEQQKEEELKEEEKEENLVEKEKVKKEEEELEEEEEGEPEARKQRPWSKYWNFRPRPVPKSKAKNRNNASGGALRIGGSAAQAPAARVQKKKLSISLTKEEIEQDILAMTGSKPVRRPRKRNRSVQKRIDYLYPGRWLPFVTADTYRVNESQPRLKM